MGRSQRPRPARLGEKLRQIRASLDLTLEQMIERLGYKDSPIYPTNISGMERGEREPPLTLLLAYARLVNISTDVLIDDDLNLPKSLGVQGGRKV
jgi:transcriptional regulator with XRE-family HTH domain